jgi:hypothetical protein
MNLAESIEAAKNPDASPTTTPNLYGIDFDV